MTRRTFRFGESLKTAQVYFYWQIQMYIFACQQIWKVHHIIFQAVAVIKDMVISNAVQSRFIVFYFNYCILGS